MITRTVVLIFRLMISLFPMVRNVIQGTYRKSLAPETDEAAAPNNGYGSAPSGGFGGAAAPYANAPPVPPSGGLLKTGLAVAGSGDLLCGTRHPIARLARPSMPELVGSASGRTHPREHLKRALPHQRSRSLVVLGQAWIGEQVPRARVIEDGAVSARGANEVAQRGDRCVVTPRIRD